MCGRFSSHIGSDILERRFEVDVKRSEVAPSFNVAPSSLIRVITKENPIVLSDMHWNYIPDDLRFFDRSRPIINARSERLLELKMYSESFQQRRCLIPVTGFYEWKKPETMNQNKIPYHIKLKNQDIFSLAGIYSNQNPVKKYIKSDSTNLASSKSCAILTTSPNDLIKPIHNRMPVIILKRHENDWMDPEADLNELLRLFDPFPKEKMMAYPVSTFVNSNKNDTEKCIQRIDEATLYKQRLGLDQAQSSLDDFY